MAGLAFMILFLSFWFSFGGFFFSGFVVWGYWVIGGGGGGEDEFGADLWGRDGVGLRLGWSGMEEEEVEMEVGKKEGKKGKEKRERQEDTGE